MSLANLLRHWGRKTVEGPNVLEHHEFALENIVSLLLSRTLEVPVSPPSGFMIA